MKCFLSYLPFAVLFLLPPVEQQDETWHETDWNHYLAEELKMEEGLILFDGMKPDLVSDTTAYEIDWMEKWPEGIGQAIYYAECTGKKPGLILLTRGNDKDEENYHEAMIAVVSMRRRYDFELIVFNTEKRKVENR